ncbi:receptor kinase-like protein Xa21 [Cornus florida]|uniref:receptor kinase-like protein Xa21 n=1 Tax=Cornus florida TaxID=4283 RepID=UPI002897DDFC|nr:receptor kinase-like protein Xa21 [Cornus florida]
MCSHLPKLGGLHLGMNYLNGQIPSKIFECRELQYLSLSVNYFTSSIPREIGNLTMQKELHLGINNLKGVIPLEIGNLPHLEILSFPSDSLTGSVPSLIFNISSLKTIDFRNNSLSGNLPVNIHEGLPILEQLDFSTNQFVGQIPSVLWKCRGLQFLSLRDNKFSGTISKEVGNLISLKELNLDGNNLTGTLPDEIGNLNLNVLDVYGNTLTSSIPFKIFNVSTMQILSLGKNHFSSNLPSDMGFWLPNLEELYLQQSGLRGTIPSYISNASRLTFIAMNANSFTGCIPNTLGSLRLLQRLFLSTNYLTRESSTPELRFLSSLTNCGKLEVLSISLNPLNGILPISLGNLSNSLQWFDAFGCQIKGNIPSGIGNQPLDFGNLKAITNIDLSWNHLSGTISSTIGGANSLVSLSLAHNKMQGSIPKSMGNLINLEFLDLSNNNLFGVIPKSLEALRYLQYFNVSFNKLQGEIPTGGHFANFTAKSFLHNDALCGAPRLQVPSCKTNKNRRLASLKYILPPIALAILVVALIFLLMGRRNQKIELQTQADWSPFAWRMVSYEELLQATQAFSETNLIGIGSYGSVYKGILLDGMSIAVKVFNLQVGGALKSFDVECEVMRNIRHQNLIKIISSCTNLDFKALVLEYMSNGSLEMWLYSHKYCLDILQRLNVMIDVASALDPAMSSSMEDSVANVADFGIAKLLSEGDIMLQTMTLATIGYMAPEYGTGGIVSTRGDVYSYGVMLMETFTRKKPTDEMFVGEMSLKSWVNDALDGSIIAVVDSNLMGSKEEEDFFVKEQCVSSILGLAVECSNDLPEKRISIEEALVVLVMEELAVMVLAVESSGIGGMQQ